MLQNKKRILSVFLAGIIIMTVLASCAEKRGTDKQDDSENADITETETEATDSYLHDNIEQRDLDGYEVKILGRFENSSFIENGIYATEQNGDAVNDEVYARNIEIMERFDCKISFEHRSDDNDELQNTLQQSIQSGSDDYQLVLFTPSYFCGLAGQNMLVDWNSLDYVQLDKEWWDENVNSTLKLGDFQYAAYGSSLLNLKLMIYHVIFNKAIAERYSVSAQELYDSARNGTWTVDELQSLAKLVKEDLNSDVKYDHEDVWGCAGESYNGYTLSLGVGAEFLTEQDDGSLLVTADSEKTTEACMKILSLFTDEEHYLITENIKGVDNVWTEMNSMMAESKVFMYLGTLRTWMREMNDDYGVLPSPKFDENQQEYRHTTTVVNAPVAAIPTTAAEPNNTAYLMELMQYQANNDILPVYYQNFLNTKMVRDQESVEMLELIHSNIFIDRCALYTLDFIDVIQQDILNKRETYVSDIAKIIKKIQRQIDDTVA